MTHEDLPALNASLNALSAILVFAGWICIKRKQVKVHKALMLTGVGVSAAFLVSYLTYHFGGEAKHFQGGDWARRAYYTMLLSHVLLAIALVPLIVTTLVFAFKDLLDKHRRLAKWTFAIWMYVSVTGVIVYFAVHG
ncbi:MAG TPA: DUF420 domain-containing protein [Planctomycetota bacterium]|nr:DUF420 domain-containing protein [Planctomycetota bacterium]